MTCHVMTSEREFHTRTRSARRAVPDTLSACRHAGTTAADPSPGPRPRGARTGSQRTQPHSVAAQASGLCFRAGSTPAPRRRCQGRVHLLRGVRSAPSRACGVRYARMAIAGSDPPRRHQSTDRTTSTRNTRRECREHPQHVLDQAGRDR